MSAPAKQFTALIVYTSLETFSKEKIP